MKAITVALAVASVFLIVSEPVEATYGCPVNGPVCNGFCITKGYVSGSCWNDRCRCSKDGELLKFDKGGCPNERKPCRYFCFDLGMDWDAGYCNGLECHCKHKGSLKIELQNGLCPGVATSCNSYCAAIGFRYGYCNGSLCECFNDQDVKLYQKFPACTESNEACNQTCIEASYDYGYCNGKDCQCDYYPLTSPLRLHNFMFCPGPKRHCDRYCKQMGMNNGLCEASTCVCFMKNEVANPFLECNNTKCALTCMEERQTSGYCGTSKELPCICFLHNENDHGRALHLPSNHYGCPENKYQRLQCTLNCLSLGFSDGYCDDAKCTCSKLNNTKELDMSTHDHNCPINAEKCATHCRVIGFKYGYCDKCACKCSMTKPKPSFADLIAIECEQNYQCISHCTSLGFRFGDCEKRKRYKNEKRCFCYGSSKDYDYIED